MKLMARGSDSDPGVPARIVGRISSLLTSESEKTKLRAHYFLKCSSPRYLVRRFVEVDDGCRGLRKLLSLRVAIVSLLCVVAYKSLTVQLSTRSSDGHSLRPVDHPRQVVSIGASV